MQIPVIGEYDVVVCGSGPAGIGAAIAAARSGLDVLLVERNSALGGMMTSGLMSDIHTYVDIKGLMGQVLNELPNKGWGFFRGNSLSGGSRTTESASTISTS